MPRISQKINVNNTYKMGKVLIISPDFPPINKISSLRAYYMAVAFAEAGWNVSVISESSEKYHNDLQRSELGVKVIRVTSDLRVAWVAKAVFLLIWLRLREQKFDLVISSHGPSSAHVLGGLAKKLSKKTIWIADYRDLWKSGNYYGKLNNNLYGTLASWFERNLIKPATIITTVSKGLAENLSKFHAKRVDVIYNGFEDSENSPHYQAIDNERITICYTGVIYAERNPVQLLRAIDGNPSARNKVQLLIAGSISSDVYRQIEKYQETGVLRCLGEVSRTKSYAIQRSADYCLLVENYEATKKGVLTGKLFEYLSIHKPIIALGVAESSEMAEIIKSAGVLAFCGNNDAELAALVDNMVGGAVAVIRPNNTFIKSLSRKAQSKIYLRLGQELLE